MTTELLITRNWWSLALRGILTILFGLIILIRPAETIELLVIFFGALALIGGIFTVLASLKIPGSKYLAAEGIISIIIGLIAFLLPGITSLVLLLLVAAWAIVTGIIQMNLAFSFFASLPGKWLLVTSGIISLLFGVLFAFRPGTGLLVIGRLIGIYALICGLLILGLAIHLRGTRGRSYI